MLFDQFFELDHRLNYLLLFIFALNGVTWHRNSQVDTSGLYFWVDFLKSPCRDRCFEVFGSLTIFEGEQTLADRV